MRPSTSEVPEARRRLPERLLTRVESFRAPGMEGLYAEMGREAQPGGRPLRERTPFPRLRGLETMTPLEPYANPTTPPDAERFYLRQIVIKFREGAPVRLREGALRIVDEPEATETSARLARSGLEPSAVADDIRVLSDIVSRASGSIGRAAPGVEESDLTRLRRRAERNAGAEQPDPNLFYFLFLPELPAEEARRIRTQIETLRSLELAYFQPIPSNAQTGDQPPATTINVTAQQGYLRPATSGGIDADFARRFAGGRGEDVRIADIEAGWNVGHEDLGAISFGFGINWGAFDSDHGTAVLGEIAARENGFGADGVAPNAVIGFSGISSALPVFFYSVGNALLQSLHALRAGDIALIEQHFPTSAGACPNTCNCAQFGYVAVETFAYEHAVISLLTGSGVIVVEAAGNGQMLVTPASSRDSGAIVVGASRVDMAAGGAGVNSFAPACFTNFGPRVDVQAWGGNIGTLGYGDDASLQANGGDRNQWYTRTFGGTSGASPIVVGAAALIQSTRTAVGQPRLDPLTMRSLLVSTGAPQAAGTTPNIGPLPNLRAAIATYIPDSARFVRQTTIPTPLTPGQSFSVTEVFGNTGSAVWTGAHRMAVGTSSASGGWPPAQSAPVGTAAAPVLATDEVSRTFTLQAPGSAGSYQLSFVLQDAVGRVLASSTPLLLVVQAPNAPLELGAITSLTGPTSLRNGQGEIATVIIQNNGQTTWSSPQYSVRLLRSGRTALPQPTLSLTGPVGPGGVQTLAFIVICNGQGGANSYGAQISGPGGNIGAPVYRSLVCQP